jgi:hypothetical protein
MPREAAEEMSTMPRGGARVNSGPPPDPNALRRDRASDKDGWVLLPAGGYDGAIPPWPLSQSIATDDPDLADVVSVRERGHWSAAWRTPQAAAWARLGWTHDVALYARWLAMAELGDMKAAGEARQWSDRLGLNPAAMLRNRWKVTTDQIGDRRAERTAPASSARERLKAVNGGGA